MTNGGGLWAKIVQERSISYELVSRGVSAVFGAGKVCDGAPSLLYKRVVLNGFIIIPFMGSIVKRAWMA